MVIRQGEVFWIEEEQPLGSEPVSRHPFVVVQNDAFNASRINTVVVCLVTSNLRRALDPGNVPLERGEGNLPKRSVVNISQIFAVSKSDLGEKFGKLSAGRMRQILRGIWLLTEPREID